MQRKENMIVADNTKNRPVRKNSGLLEKIKLNNLSYSFKLNLCQEKFWIVSGVNLYALPST